MLKSLAAALALLFVVGWQTSFGQACSCAGAPLMGALETAASRAGDWQVGLTYEFSSIGDVYSGTTRFDDDTRRRRIHAGLMEINYGLSGRITVATLFTFMQQERRSEAVIGSGQTLDTRGFGDGLLLLKYNLYPPNINTRRQISVGAGVKMPLGASDLTFNNLLVAADMQPGSGAWDGVLWANASQGLFRDIPVNLSLTTTYRFMGINDRFGLDRESYRFGNEFTLMIGAGIVSDNPLTYTLGFRFRSTAPDKFDGDNVPNSGGKWLNMEPGVNLNILEPVSLRISGQVPVYRNVEGTQLTTSYTLSLSLFYSFVKASPGLKL